MRKILNFSFVLLLCFPLIIYLISPVQKISASEKRKLAVFPEIELRNFSLHKYTRQFELYWKDHFGLRNQLLSFNEQLQTNVFNKSSVKTVIKGKDGWLFLNMPHIVADFLGTRNLPDERFVKWAATVKKRSEWLALQNIHYILLPVPSKLNIYSEYLPDRYSFFRKGDSKTSLELLDQYLESSSQLKNVVQLTPLYLQEKSNKRLYYKSDTHWSWQGAYSAYREVINKLNYWYPDMQPLLYSSLNVSEGKRKGDLSVMLGRKEESMEQAEKVKVIDSCVTASYRLPDHNSAETHSDPLVTICETGTYTAVVSYDSYVAQILPFISQSFKKVTYVSSKDFKWLKGFLVKEKPDVFIHEQAARGMQEMLHDTWHLTDELQK